MFLARRIDERRGWSDGKQRDSSAIPATAVVDAIERAALTAWAESVIEKDAERLGDLRAGGHDRTVEEFRSADRALVEHAASRVRNASRTSSGRRASSAPPAHPARGREEAGTCRSASCSADRRGRPGVQAVLHDEPAVGEPVPARRRCTFDVVIFDEASQVRPCDAINSIYRARQLIVAGDDKQLPPTSFFDRIGPTTATCTTRKQLDDFESVLDLCRSAAQLPAAAAALALPQPPRVADHVLQPRVLRRPAGHLPGALTRGARPRRRVHPRRRRRLRARRQPRQPDRGAGRRRAGAAITPSADPSSPSASSPSPRRRPAASAMELEAARRRRGPTSTTASPRTASTASSSRTSRTSRATSATSSSSASATAATRPASSR